MADIIFNRARGSINELQRRVVNNDPVNAGIMVVLIKTTEADAALQKHESLAAVLAGSSVECDFDGYARKILTDAELSLPTINHTTNKQSSALTELNWPNAGTTTTNSIVKAIPCYVPDVTNIVEANVIPLTANDVTETVDGTNLKLNAGPYNN